MNVEYGKEKADLIFKERGIDLKIVSTMIENGDFLNIQPHPKRKDQVIFSILYEEYILAVPCKVEDYGYFIKSAWHSRKLNNLYNRGK